MKPSLGLFAFVLSMVGLVAAEPPPLLPVETFFKNPEFTHVSFSPDGKSIALLQSIDNRMNIVVLDLEKMEKRQLTRYKRQNIAFYEWVGSDHLAFWADYDGNESFSMFVIKRDGTGYKDLGGGRFLSRLEGQTDHILVEWADAKRTGTNVHRLNLRTGRTSPHLVNPGSVTDWITDRRGVVRIRIAMDEERRTVMHRAADGAEWEVLDVRSLLAPTWHPLGFDGDHRTLFVTTSDGRATSAVYRYDTVTRQREAEPVCADARYDVGSLIYSESLQRVVGIRYEGEKPVTRWIDSRFEAYQRAADAALPDTLNEVRDATPDGQKLLLYASSEREPGIFYLMDLARKKITEIAVTRSWIDPAQMAPMQPVSFTARDGLSLHGYLTLPAGRAPKNLPLVLLVHGGPFGIRDSWGFDREGQFLANRGFAVLQVNYRGSGGYGPAFEAAGYQKWGLEMQDDLTDAVRWAIAQGVADPRRVVIMGASYGGYAVMAGLAFTPDLYCAGVNIVGVTGIRDFLRDRDGPPSRSDALLTERWGDLKRDRERIKRTSADNFMTQVRAPVFMAYGENDPRVPVEHGKRYRDALKQAGKPFELFIEDEEGHGFRKEQNTVELYRKIEDFLRRHVPRE